MKKITSCCLILAAFLFLISPAPAQAPNKEYLPGDFVQLVVDAPVDTAQISATMPDGSVISLVHERKSTLWRGIWEVPVNFSKGTYSARLRAIDLEGNVFEGLSDTFTINQLAMIMLVGKGTPEAKLSNVPLREKITVEAVPAGIPEAQLINEIRKMVAQAVAGPAPKLNISEKSLLIESNMTSGKDNLSRDRPAMAAANFRVVLFLDPNNKEAGTYLGEARDKLAKAEGEQHQLMMLIVAGTLVILLLLGTIIFSIFRALNRLASQGGAHPPAPKTEKEKIKLWFSRTGWKGDPFAADALKQLFGGNNPLGIDGFKNLISSRIESAGGKGLAPFTGAAIDVIFAYSKGKPKDALKVCAWTVAQAIDQSAEKITAEMVKGYEQVGFRTILIADDEESARTSLDAILRKAGNYQTDFAIDGEDTIKKIKENVYGLVLLDIEMPKVSGYEILRQIRAVYPELPIVFVTGKGDPHKTVESFGKFNLSGYIEKPFTAERVLDVVAKVFRTR